MLLAQGILLIIAMVVGLIAIALQLAMNIRECMKPDEPEPQEQLTEQELAYCENDVQIINRYIKQEMLQNGNSIANIPYVKVVVELKGKGWNNNA